ncbi:MAG: YeeE/YedE family protein, partial [Alphaproteobacteria bacterium]|nr:YeeE/YedE family protein [Alphaproteobacteria bacterium]
LRRAVAGDQGDRNAATGVWLAGLATAVLAVQALGMLGFVSLDEHRWSSADLPIFALVAGGLAFGVGMVLTRGCVSRLTVLASAGNLRAVTVVVLFAIIAHAMLKGVLAPLRVSIGSLTIESPVASLANLPGGAGLWTALVVLPLAAFAWRSHARRSHLALGGVIGLVAALGWAGTSVLLFDEFDPLPVQSLAFTLPWSETLFWTIASTAVPATFGVGFLAGVIGGAFLSALLRREVRLESFETPGQTMRYGLGAALMGAGGVLAGGCTVGAGIAGGATLSVAALVALISIVAGGHAARIALSKPAGLGSTPVTT